MLAATTTATKTSNHYKMDQEDIEIDPEFVRLPAHQLQLPLTRAYVPLPLLMLDSSTTSLTTAMKRLASRRAPRRLRSRSIRTFLRTVCSPAPPPVCTFWALIWAPGRRYHSYFGADKNLHPTDEVRRRKSCACAT